MADQSLSSNQPDLTLPVSRDRQQRLELVRVFLLIILTIAVSAIITAIIGQKLQRLYKEELHLSVSQVGTLGILIGIPAYIQPFMGAWSDLFPLFGYRRRSYYIIGTLVEALGFYGLSTLHQYHYAMIACLIIVYATGSTLLYVMMNAVMVAVGNRSGTFGSMQSVLQAIPLILGLTYTAQLRSYTVVHWTYQHCFWTAVVLCLIRASFALLIDEKRVTRSKQTPEEQAAHLETRREEQARTREALRKAASSPGLWAIVAFVFYLILTPGINNAIYYYQKDALHLSDAFIGTLLRWTAAGTMLGLIVFAFGSRFLPVRALVWGAFGMDCLSYVTLVGMHNATSAEVITLLYATVGVLYALCLNTLAARACPPGIEGTVYGLVLAAIALGGTLSEKIGAWLYDFFGPANHAQHYSLLHGWDWALGVGFVFTVLAAVFIPFLPAWTRSNQPLRKTVAESME